MLTPHKEVIWNTSEYNFMGVANAGDRTAVLTDGSFSFSEVFNKSLSWEYDRGIP